MTSALEDMKPLDITQWLTLNTASSASKLSTGQTPNAKNTWVDEKPGSVITANGFRKVGTLPSNNPCTFCIDYFKTSSGTQTFVCSDNSTVWTTVDFQNFTEIVTGLSSAFQLRGLVIRDKLWLTNGSDAVRTFDGSSVVVLDGSSGKPDVPKGRYISYHDERVWLYHIPSNRSQLVFSSLTDASANIIAPDSADAWSGVGDNNLQISEGDADFGTGLMLYRGYLFMFKQYSVWRLIGYDEYTYGRVRTRASTGTRFNESLQELDGAIHMIGVDGIYVFDGDSSQRISDIIDPASTSQSSFGFNTLQQPNSNNQFWEVSATSDWNAGVVIPTNGTINDSLIHSPADSSKSDFDAGVLKTNIDTAEVVDAIKLTRQAFGGSLERIGQGNSAQLTYSMSSAAIQYGQPFFLTDGNPSSLAGMGSSGFNLMRFIVDLGPGIVTHYDIGRVVLRATQTDGGSPLYSVQVNTGAYQYPGASNGTWVEVASSAWTSTPTDRIFDFAVQNAIQVSVYFSTNGGSHQLGEIEVYSARYQTSGKFTSKSLDYTNPPSSYGNFNADLDYNGGNAVFFTQSSADGSSWDAEVVCTNAGAIGSTIRRYIRWGVYFTSTGFYSPILYAAWLTSKYESVIHNTGGSIFSWGPFESDYKLNGQTINFYYRGAATAGAVPSASWNLVVPGGALSIDVSLVYVQFKIEILGGTATTIPVVNSVTVNWVKGTGIEAQTLQNVASFFWRNRYWMSAASKGSAANDTILIRGKKTFQSPWQLKDWPILSFCRFQDGFYGGSSVDGSIYQLDTGYSKDGSAMDSYFETGDFTFMGNHIHCHEVELEVERMGSYNLKFGVSIDRGNTWTEYDVDLTESAFSTSYWKKLLVDPGTTPIIRFRVRTNGVDQPFEVHNLRAYYEIRTARGSLR